MKRYTILAAVAATLAAATFGYHELAPKKKICQNVYSMHAYGRWQATSQVSRSMVGHDKLLMQRKCFRCGHIESQASD